MDKNLIPKDAKVFGKTTKEEFLQKIKEEINKILLQNEDVFGESFSEEYDPPTDEDFYTKGEYDIEFVYRNSKIIQEDLNWMYLGGGENFTSSMTYGRHRDKEQTSLVGLHTLPNGMTIAGCMDGGDWEMPYFFFLYWNGKNIRAYFPRYGNMANFDALAPFGSDSDGRVCPKELDKLYGPPPAQNTIVGFYDEEEWYAGKYLAKQGISFDDINEYDINWNAIEEEILTVFKIEV